MRLAFACILFGCVLSQAATAQHLSLSNTMPTVTFVVADGHVLTTAESAQIHEAMHKVADDCAFMLAPQFGLTPKELEESMKMTQNHSLQFAWGQCISEYMANAYENHRFPSGVNVIVVAPR